MAKKGQVVALQIDVSNEEDWEKMKTEKHGVILVDVYTEWCGPCVGMCGNLKKVKLEIGGENITYVTAKSDAIEELARFRKKSEPTWMFISNGRMTNLMFGPDGPRLMRMIVDEVKKEKQIAAGLREREDMAITDIAPEEKKRSAEIEELHGEAMRIERELQQKKADNRRREIADAVAEGMQDHGLLLLWPHATGAFSEVMEMCEGLELQLVSFEKKVLTMGDIKECFFGTEPPLMPQAITCLLNAASMGILLQAKEEFKGTSVDETLLEVIERLGEKWLLEYKGEPAHSSHASYLDAMGDEEEYARTETKSGLTSVSAIAPPASEATTGYTSDTDELRKTPKDEWGLMPESPLPDFDAKSELTSKSEMDEMEEEEPYEEEEPEPIIIQGIYTPPNPTAKGAAIASLFPAAAFDHIPPAPIPIPPHVAIIFDAFKKKDVIDMIKDNMQYVMNMGFFSSGDASTAQLVAKTNREFDKKRPPPGQKLVIMVMKKPSAGLLSLAQLGPTYVSPNAEVGEQECKKFFPAGYSEGEFTLDEERIEKEAPPQEGGKKKKKGKKGDEPPSTEEAEKDKAAEGAAEAGTEKVAAEGGPAPEGAVPTAEGAAAAPEGGAPAPEGGAPAAEGGAPAAEAGAPAAEPGAPPAEPGVPPAEAGAPTVEGAAPAPATEGAAPTTEAPAGEAAPAPTDTPAAGDAPAESAPAADTPAA